MFFKNKGFIILAVFVSFIVMGLAFDVYRVNKARKDVDVAAHKITSVSEVELPYYRFRVKPKAEEIAKEYGAILRKDGLHFKMNDHRLDVKVWKKVPMFVGKIFGKTEVEVVGQSVLAVIVKGAGILNAIPLKDVFGGIVIDASFPFQQRILFGFTPLREGEKPRSDQIAIVKLVASGGEVLRVGENVESRPFVDEEEVKKKVERIVAKDPDSRIELYGQESPRIVVMAMLSGNELEGKEETKKILGFAAFFVEKFEDHLLQGYFVTHYISGKVDSEAGSPSMDYGLWKKGEASPRIVQ